MRTGAGVAHVGGMALVIRRRLKTGARAVAACLCMTVAAAAVAAWSATLATAAASPGTVAPGVATPGVGTPGVATSGGAGPAIDVFGRPITATPPADSSNGSDSGSDASQAATAVHPPDGTRASDASAAKPGADVPESSPQPAHVFHLPEPVRATLAAGLMLQGELDSRIEDAANELHHSSSPRVWLTLVLMSLAYGMLHAVGPGHGKLAVGTWLGSRRARVTQALLLGGWTASVQAISAIVLVFGAAWLSASGLSMVLSRAESLEIVSYTLLCAVGVWALWNALRNADCCFDPNAIRLTPTKAQMRIRDGNGDGDSDEGNAYLGARIQLRRFEGARRTRVFGADTDRRTTPVARGYSTWVASVRTAPLAQFLATGVAAGVRPCVGAIFVLVASIAAHAPWVGIASVFAMAFGVAITVSVVGLAGVGANRLVASQPRSRRRLQTTQRMLATVGALILIAFAGVQVAMLLTGQMAASLT